MIFRAMKLVRLPLTSALPPAPRGFATRACVIFKPIMIMTLASIAIALGGTSIGPAHAENPDISSRRASERTDFTNDEIKDGFFKIAFNAELQLGVRAERIRKFDEPVRIFVASNGHSDRRSQIAAIIEDIRARVNHLDVAVTNDRHAANFVITLVANRDLRRTIRSRYGSDRATRIQQTLNPQCLSGIGKDSRYRIRRAEVILPVDAGAGSNQRRPVGPLDDVQRRRPNGLLRYLRPVSSEHSVRSAPSPGDDQRGGQRVVAGRFAHRPGLGESNQFATPRRPA
jgi:hypothetical protein